ncbi:MAG: fumarate hydratase C-terminal domain-containing protein [Victivallales bacterium]|nr:fumarate hydratase C-terminal domain-containing protein [Victivallales bacterium]
MNSTIVNLNTPLEEETVRKLRCGDQVRISGVIYTARDAAHKYLAGEGAVLPPEIILDGGIVYHCGPVMVQENGEWRVTAAGPTTSAREEPYMAEVIRKYRLRAIIGKGGMGQKTLDACRRYGCVYLSATGGAAQLLADAVKRVPAVHFLEDFGSPEAMWTMQVVDFPAVVTMDAQGRNIHQEVLESSRNILDRLA